MPDAMPGGGTLTITTANGHAAEDDLAAGDYVVVAVRDDGIGMAPEIAAKAFEPFFTTKDIGRGSGLGLSMVYGFARQSGGTARLETQRGAGTVVRLFLPRAEGVPDQQPATRLDGAPTGAGLVLVVEDDDEVRRTSGDMLEALGYHVLLAPDGPAALALLRGNEDVDVLLSDIVMPGGINGAELARRARRIRPELKVILTSGYTADHTQAAEEASKFAFIGKPFRPAEIGRLLKSLLGEGTPGPA